MGLQVGMGLIINEHEGHLWGDETILRLDRLW